MVVPLTGLPLAESRHRRWSPSPCRLVAAEEHLTSNFQELNGTVFGPQQRGNVLDPLGLQLRLDLLDWASHGRVRADLDEKVDVRELLRTQNGLNSLVEQHGAAQVRAPVSLVQDAPLREDGVSDRRHHLGSRGKR